MWMMGFNEGGEFNMTDSFNGRKLRPLMPRQASASNNPSVLSGVTEGDVLALNHHHLGMVGDQLRREFNSQQVVVSSRWNPTPEQLQTLEELYRRGTRTPSAEQIQHITSQLRRYGKIEGKNVFYWFQNHKARERQKRRRQLESHPEDNSRDTERKETGTNRTGFEVELTKIWASPSSTNCTTTVPERNVSTQKAAKARVPEYRTDGWAQFNEGESQQIRRNGTWQTMLMSCSPPTHLIDSITTTTHTTATLRMGDPLLIKSPDLNIFVAPPYTEDLNYWLSVSDNSVDDGDESRTLQLLDGRDESQTLQLFPLRNNDGDSNNTDKETEISVEDHMNSSFTPCQFFEFLPLRT